VIKFVSDLRQVDGFLPVLWFPPPRKLTAMEITEILKEVDFAISQASITY
jgi:hypothetical protein